MKDTKISPLPFLPQYLQTIHPLAPLPYFNHQNIKQPYQQINTSSFSQRKSNIKSNKQKNAYSPSISPYKNINQKKHPIFINEIHQHNQFQQQQQQKNFGKYKEKIKDLIKEKQSKQSEANYYKKTSFSKQVQNEILEKKIKQFSLMNEYLIKQNKKFKQETQNFKALISKKDDEISELNKKIVNKSSTTKITLNSTNRFKGNSFHNQSKQYQRSQNIPTVKITVPNPKQNDKQSYFRQMREAGEQIFKLKKLLQGQKQKNQYLQMNFKNNKKQADKIKQQNQQILQKLRQKQRQIDTYQRTKMNQIFFEAINKNINSNSRIKDEQIKKLQMDKQILKLALTNKQKQNLELQQRLIKFGTPYTSNFKNQAQNINFEDKKSQNQKNQFETVKKLTYTSNSQNLNHNENQFINSKQRQFNNYDQFKNINTNNFQYVNLNQKLDHKVEQQISSNRSDNIERQIKEIKQFYIKKVQSLNEQIQSLKKTRSFQDFQIQQMYKVLNKKKQQIAVCYQQNLQMKKVLNSNNILSYKA